MLWQQKTGAFFNFGAFFNALSYTPELNVEHATIAIKAGVCCVRVCNFSIIACIDLLLMLIYKIL
jgi:hypothetical protein